MRIKNGKKRIGGLLVLLLSFCLAGCGGEKAPAPAEKAAPTVTELLPDAAEPTEEAPTEEVQKEETEKTEAKEEDGAEVPEGQMEDKEAMDEKKQEVKHAELVYLGHASLRIQTPEDKVIYIDPFFGNDYTKPSDLILQTHGHYDHSALDKVSVRSEGCVVITQNEALAGGVHQSFDLVDVHIEAVEAGNNANHSLANCVGYVLTFSDGVKLYVSGDTSRTAQMEKLALEQIDYAFFCCDGVYNMDVAEASECAALVGAAHSIPYHMVPSDNAAGFDRSVAERFEAEGRIILATGDKLVLEK